jgi:nucleoside-diphosphate-sugar epimerase
LGRVPTIAITGAGGFIGFRLAERALERGWQVRGLELLSQAAARVERIGAWVQTGDTGDEAAGRRLCGGADAIVHTAAIVGEGGDWARYRKVNVEGTRTMARAAKAAGVARFVHLSSVMVYGFDYPDDIAEDGPLRGENNPYCQTKIESEAAVREVFPIGATLIRPGDVYGPGSIPWVVRPLGAMQKSVFILPDGGRGILNHVYVDNLIDGIFAAIDRNADGAFNITDGVATTFLDYFNRLARLAGKKSVRTLPAPLLRGIVRVVGAAERLFGRPPTALPESIAFINRKGRYSIERARTQLGYTPAIDLDEGFRRVETWLRREKLI